MMCELFGKATGFNGGKGGSMHIADFSVGMLGANGVVAGVVAPLVMHSAVALAIASLAMLGLGLQAWLWAHRRWPDIGRSVVNAEH
jgi:hypothetical protein